MPRRDDIKKVMIIGSGPIVIGQACENLGIEGVDLYGGTRHSTAVYLREIGHSPEAIKRATMHSTNKAFDRYLRISGSEVRPIYQDARGSKKALPNDNAHPQKCKRSVNVISFTLNKKYELNQ